MHPPTPEQAAIIEFAKTRSENLCINALAGAAKTTTLEMICHAVDDIPILSLAFNKRIADELSKRLPSHVECRTLNSLGHRVWAQATGKRLIVNTNKLGDILKQYIGDQPQRQRADLWDEFSVILGWLRQAKRDGWLPRKWRGLGKGLTETLENDEETIPEHLRHVVEHCLEKSIEQGYAGVIDYDDQLYMPVCFGAPWPKYPLVLCDEVQDLSPINHAMLEALIYRRAIIVGDPWQSIYGFRGAVAGGMRQLVHKFNMHEMTLSVTFRVPKKGVERAHFRVPHMRAPDWQIEGNITRLEEWEASVIPNNSAILCRNNAPLFRCALRFIKAGRSCKLVGMDIGPGLVRIMKKLGPPSLTRPQIESALDRWLQAELAKAKSEHIVWEKYECLQVLCLRDEAPNLGMAIAMAESLFKQNGPIQLLSGHKSKGLEWDHVFILDSWRCPSKWAKEGTEAYEQELNCKYVMETRFKETMTFIDMEAYNG